jgi:hypothetical protein
VKIFSLPFGKIDANLLGRWHSPGPMPLGPRTRAGGFLPLKRFCVATRASRLARLGVPVLHGYERDTDITLTSPSAVPCNTGQAREKRTPQI